MSSKNLTEQEQALLYDCMGKFSDPGTSADEIAEKLFQLTGTFVCKRSGKMESESYAEMLMDEVRDLQKTIGGLYTLTRIGCHGESFIGPEYIFGENSILALTLMSVAEMNVMHECIKSVHDQKELSISYVEAYILFALADDYIRTVSAIEEPAFLMDSASRHVSDALSLIGEAMEIVTGEKTDTLAMYKSAHAKIKEALVHTIKSGICSLRTARKLGLSESDMVHTDKNGWARETESVSGERDIKELISKVINLQQ